MILLATSVVMMKKILLPDRIFTTTAIRLASATLFLLPALLVRKEREAIVGVFRPSPLWKLAVPSCLMGGVLAMVSWIGGLTLTTISRASILNQLSTIFVFLLSFLVLKEPLTRRRVSAVVIAFTGTLIVIWATNR